LGGNKMRLLGKQNETVVTSFPTGQEHFVMLQHIRWIFRFGIDPSGGWFGRLKPPKSAVFESTAALRLLPSRSYSTKGTKGSNLET
jgi:hypothetical protein